jgi:hypothetical protein
VTINRDEYNRPAAGEWIQITRSSSFSDVADFQLRLSTTATWLQANMSPYDTISMSTNWYGTSQSSGDVQLIVIARAVNGRELSRQVVPVNLIVTPYRPS